MCSEDCDSIWRSDCGCLFSHNCHCSWSNIINWMSYRPPIFSYPRPNKNNSFKKLCGRQLLILTWLSMICASWYSHHCVIPSPLVWTGHSDLLLMNITWQKWWDVTFMIRLQEVVTSILIALSFSLTSILLALAHSSEATCHVGRCYVENLHRKKRPWLWEEMKL